MIHWQWFWWWFLSVLQFMRKIYGKKMYILFFCTSYFSRSPEKCINKWIIVQLFSTFIVKRNVCLAAIQHIDCQRPNINAKVAEGKNSGLREKNHSFLHMCSVGVRVQLLCWTDIHTLICVLSVWEGSHELHFISESRHGQQGKQGLKEHKNPRNF